MIPWPMTCDRMLWPRLWPWLVKALLLPQHVTCKERKRTTWSTAQVLVAQSFSHAGNLSNQFKSHKSQINICKLTHAFPGTACVQLQSAEKSKYDSPTRSLVRSLVRYARSLVRSPTYARSYARSTHTRTLFVRYVTKALKIMVYEALEKAKVSPVCKTYISKQTSASWLAMVNKHPVAIFFVFTHLDFFKKYQRTTSYSRTSTWYYMIVYIIYIHIFSTLFWTSFGSPWTSAFASDFCAGNHRLKTASFEAFVLHRFVHPRSHLIKRQIFGIIV